MANPSNGKPTSKFDFGGARGRNERSCLHTLRAHTHTHTLTLTRLMSPSKRAGCVRRLTARDHNTELSLILLSIYALIKSPAPPLIPTYL